MTREIGDYGPTRWHFCRDGCGAKYRSESAARYCCNRRLQAAAKARRQLEGGR